MFSKVSGFFKALLSSDVRRRSTFLTSSAGSRLSGRMPEEAEEGFGVAVAGIVLVIDDLLHGPARVDGEGFELDLDDGHAVDEQDDVVAVVAVVGVGRIAAGLYQSRAALDMGFVICSTRYFINASTRRYAGTMA